MHSENYFLKVAGCPDVFLDFFLVSGRIEGTQISHNRLFLMLTLHQPNNHVYFLHLIHVLKVMFSGQYSFVFCRARRPCFLCSDTGYLICHSQFSYSTLCNVYNIRATLDKPKIKQLITCEMQLSFAELLSRLISRHCFDNLYYQK